MKIEYGRCLTLQGNNKRLLSSQNTLQTDLPLLADFNPHKLLFQQQC